MQSILPQLDANAIQALTGDLGGKAKTAEYAEAIMKRL